MYTREVEAYIKNNYPHNASLEDLMQLTGKSKVSMIAKLSSMKVYSKEAVAKKEKAKTKLELVKEIENQFVLLGTLSAGGLPGLDKSPKQTLVKLLELIPR